MGAKNNFDNEVAFTNNFRKMSMSQLKEKYHKSESTIIAFAKHLGLDRSKIIQSLTDEEVIFMYESMIRGEILSFTNGMFKSEQYIPILIRHLISNNLQWSRNDICDKFCTNLLKEHKLGGLLGLKGFCLFSNLAKAFPEYNIKPWELKNSSCKWTESTILDLSVWIKEHLLINKNLKDIHEAGGYGFSRILDEYALNALCFSRFDSSTVKMFEFIYGEEYNKEEMLKINYKFSSHAEEMTRNKENILYKLTDQYHTIDPIGKTLIDEIIRFCETQNKFPVEKELVNKNGFISRTQFYKYSQSRSLEFIYKYIIPIYDLSKETDSNNFTYICQKQHCDVIIIPPLRLKCIKCEEIKDFTDEYFLKSEYQKMKLQYICKTCNASESQRKHYASMGINYIHIEDIVPEQWYEYFYKGDIDIMPRFCFVDCNLIKIIRYLFIDKLLITNGDDLLEKFNTIHFSMFKIESIVNRLGGKFATMQKCFPDFEIQIDNANRTKYINNNEISDIITNWMKESNLNIIDILTLTLRDKLDNQMLSMIYCVFKTQMNTFLWYFKFNKIFHPLYNREIEVFDFYYTPENYYNDKDNRIKRIKHYCEFETENIVDKLNNTKSIQQWIYSNFTSEKISKILTDYGNYGSLYDILTESYPTLVENKILFEWEWHQCAKSDKNFLLQMMREFILHRMTNVILNLEIDIPIYINRSYLHHICPKLQSRINKKRFESYYEWCCLAFPEYASKWSLNMFEDCVAYDDAICGSKQELYLYESIKREMGFSHLKNIGSQKSGKYVYDVRNASQDYSKFCPDFILEEVVIADSTIKLNKPIIFEYYGMYQPNSTYYIFQNYIKKTHVKNNFYKNNENIEFIDIYPNDLKDLSKIKSRIENIIHKQMVLSKIIN